MDWKSLSSRKQLFAGGTQDAKWSTVIKFLSSLRHENKNSYP